MGLRDCGRALLQVGAHFCQREETPPIPTTQYRDSWYSFPAAVSMSHLSVLQQQDLKELWPEAPTLCETTLALSACLRPDAVWIENSAAFSSPKQEEVFAVRLSLLVKGQRELLIHPALQSFLCKCFYCVSWSSSLVGDSQSVHSA